VARAFSNVPMQAVAAVLVAHDQTAVDVDGLARHVIGVAASEKAHDARHVLRGFGSAERDKRGAPLPGFTDFPALDLCEVILSAASTCAAVRVMLTTPALLAA
jgi:hypothetical protein